MQPFDIFTAYSHYDEKLRDDLEVHLALLKKHDLATIFHDRKILAGQHWETELDTKLFDADLILLLVSPHFLASDYCYGVEMQTALDLQRREAAVVIPVILRPCEWQEEPALAGLQALPRDGKPITKWSDQDEAFLDVAKGVRKVVSELAPKPIPIELVLSWSPSAMVAARFNRILSGSLARVPSSVIMILPDQGVIEDSLVAAIVVTGPDGEPAEGVPVRIQLRGGSWGAPVGKSDLPPNSPIDTATGLGGAIWLKIFPEAPEVFLIVEAAGYPKQVGRFVACRR